MSKRLFKGFLATVILLCMTFFVSCSTGVPGGSTNNEGSIKSDSKSGVLYVHFIDVGQADSILVKAPSGKNMLIDAGNNADADKIIGYLKKQGVSKIDILIGTHPHEDHIGSLDSIIKEFKIGSLYMPKVTANTKTFSDVIDAAKSKGMSINVAKCGVKLDLGDGIDVQMLAPISGKYDDLNEYSAVVKLVYGKSSFLFTGDAGKVSEAQMLQKNEDVEASVLKVGHHGSSSATSKAFLDKVNPRYAVISVGKGNDYGHPAQATLNNLKKKGVTILRTDQSGDIVFSTDGKNLELVK